MTGPSISGQLLGLWEANCASAVDQQVRGLRLDSIRTFHGSDDAVLAPPGRWAASTQGPVSLGGLPGTTTRATPTTRWMSNLNLRPVARSASSRLAMHGVPGGHQSSSSLHRLSLSTTDTGSRPREALTEILARNRRPCRLSRETAGAPAITL